MPDWAWSWQTWAADCPRKPAEPGQSNRRRDRQTTLYGLPAPSWTSFNHWKADSSMVFFYGNVFYDTIVLWPAADGKASSLQACIVKQTGQRSGLVPWEQCQLFVIQALLIIPSWCKNYSDFANVKLPYLFETWFFFCVRWDQRNQTTIELSKSQRLSHIPVRAVLYLLLFNVLSTVCSALWRQKISRKIYYTCLLRWLCLKEQSISCCL